MASITSGHSTGDIHRPLSPARMIKPPIRPNIKSNTPPAKFIIQISMVNGICALGPGTINSSLEYFNKNLTVPGPNVVNLTLRLTRKRGSYFLQIYLSKDLTKPPKSEVASRPCQSRGCSQRREPLTALQGGQSYESNQHLQKHYSIHP